MYILTNRDKNVLYIGVTNDLAVRLKQHHDGINSRKSFTGKYHCYYLVYYERFSQVEHAIEREKEVKKWRREKKNALIESNNAEWTFLNNQVSDYRI